MQPSKIFKKGIKILRIGFSKKGCNNTKAVAFQKKTHDDRDVMRFITHANAAPFLGTVNASNI